MATCVYCGEKVNDGDICCLNCGRPLPRNIELNSPLKKFKQRKQ